MRACNYRLLYVVANIQRVLGSDYPTVTYKGNACKRLSTKYNTGCRKTVITAPAHSIHLNSDKENVLHINGGEGGSIPVG